MQRRYSTRTGQPGDAHTHRSARGEPMTGNFQQALRDELLAAARRSLIPARRPWWRRTRTVVGAVAAAAAGVGVMAVATLGPAAASGTITAAGDMVTVTLNDKSNSRDENENPIDTQRTHPDNREGAGG